MKLALTSLGDEPQVTEALSKVFALLVPEAVPLMPPPARRFVLGGESDGPGAFGRIVDFVRSCGRDLRGGAHGARRRAARGRGSRPQGSPRSAPLVRLGGARALPEDRLKRAKHPEPHDPRHFPSIRRPHSGVPGASPRVERPLTRVRRPSTRERRPVRRASWPRPSDGRRLPRAKRRRPRV